MTVRRVGFLILATAMAVLLGVQSAAAAGKAEGGAAGATKIRFAHMWQAGASPEADTAIAILKKLQADHPEIQIASEVVVGDEMRNKIRVDVSANNTPDIWQFWVGGVLNDYAKSGVLADVSQYLAKSTKLKKSDIPDSAWETTTIDGVIRGVPRNIALGSFFVNKDLFDKYNLKYPKTWAEFLAVGKEFRSHGVIPTNIGSKGGNPSHFWYGDLVCQYNSGVTISKDVGKVLSFRDPSLLKAADYVAQMRDGKMFPDDVVANGDWAPSIALYNQGNVAMGYTFPWNYQQMPADIVAKTEIIPIPRLPDAERDPSTFIQGTVNDAYVMSAKAFADPKKQQALVTIMDTIDKDIGFALAQRGSMVSVDTDVMSRVDKSKIPTPMMVKAIDYQLRTKESGSPMIWQNLPDNKTQFDYQSGLDELWAGSMSPQEYIDKVQKSLDNYRATH